MQTLRGPHRTQSLRMEQMAYKISRQSEVGCGRRVASDMLIIIYMKSVK
jgi:hypothetical protein